jgi:putative addiction module CopG family antidote
MSITINLEIESMIQSFLGSGEYADANEVLQNALELLRERDESPAWNVAALRKEIEKGREDVRNGRVTYKTVDEMAQESLQEYKQKNEMR